MKNSWDPNEPAVITESARVIHVMTDVLEERRQQFEKWGSQAHKPDYVWSLILMEEFGELIDELSSKNDENARVESIQTTAVASAWAEAILERGSFVGNDNNVEQFVFAFFSHAGYMAKALLENRNTDAWSHIMRIMACLNNLRDSVEALEGIAIDPSKPQDSNG